MAEELTGLLKACGIMKTLQCKDGAAGRVLYAGSNCADVISGLNAIVEMVGFKPDFDQLTCSVFGYIRERVGCDATVGYLNSAVSLHSAGRLGECKHTSQTSTATSSVTSTATTSATTTVTTAVTGALDCVKEDGLTYLSVATIGRCTSQVAYVHGLLELCGNGAAAMTCNEAA